LNWEKDYNTEVTDPIITKSGLVMGIDGDLVLIDVSSGNEKERIAIKNGSINQMTIIGDSIFAVMNDNQIIRLDK
jgi:ribosomal protein S4E